MIWIWDVDKLCGFHALCLVNWNLAAACWWCQRRSALLLLLLLKYSSMLLSAFQSSSLIMFGIFWSMKTGQSQSLTTLCYYLDVLPPPPPPKFNIAPESYLPNRKVVFQPPYFRVFVKLWGCIFHVPPFLPPRLQRFNSEPSKGCIHDKPIICLKPPAWIPWIHLLGRKLVNVWKGIGI